MKSYQFYQLYGECLQGFAASIKAAEDMMDKALPDAEGVSAKNEIMMDIYYAAKLREKVESRVKTLQARVRLLTP